MPLDMPPKRKLATPSERPKGPSRAQKRKHTDEDEHSQKRPRRDPPSAPTPAAVSQELVGVLQTLENKQGNKRPRDSENEPWNKRRRPSVTESLLSEENLKKLQSELEKSKGMQPVATPLERVRKRGPSRQTSCSDLNDAASTRSQRSAGSLKFYRYNVLARARVYIHSEYPPAEIQALLDVIFTREITKTRRREISRIAKETAKEFSNKTRGAHRENDLIEALYDAFCEMFPDKKFNCPRKADWDPNLKPGIQQEHVWDPDALGQANNETDDAIDRPSKRQQVNGSFPSPDTLQSTSQPPAAPSQPKQDGAVRNPRPDFTFGHHHPTITGALMKRGLSRFKADDFPRFLQQQQRLFSDPTMDYLDVRFPIQTFEGKAYATGRPVFEAENQAAVSGACMVNLQQQLTDLYESVFPDSKESQTPFAFSVCTEGPVIQFWVHYFLIEEGIRMHYMNLLSICNGSLYDTLEVLLVKWEQLMGWYGDDFLKEIADRLYDLANHTAHS